MKKRRRHEAARRDDLLKIFTAEELLKLKLERFRKQDPEDIYAIIEKAGISYDQFKSIAQEMLLFFIGNPRELLLSALIVVERMYPEKQDDFKILLAASPAAG